MHFAKFFINCCLKFESKVWFQLNGHYFWLLKCTLTIKSIKKQDSWKIIQNLRKKIQTSKIRVSLGDTKHPGRTRPGLGDIYSLKECVHPHKTKPHNTQQCKKCVWCITVADLNSSRGVWPFRLLPLPPAVTQPTLSNSLSALQIQNPACLQQLGRERPTAQWWTQWGGDEPLPALFEKLSCKPKSPCGCLGVGDSSVCASHCVNKITDLSPQRQDFSRSLHLLLWYDNRSGIPGRATELYITRAEHQRALYLLLPPWAPLPSGG